MPGSRRANPAIRKLAVAVVLAVAMAGMLFTVCCLRVESVIQSWITAEPQTVSHRIKIVLAIIDALISLPLFVFSCYFWRLGARVIRDQAYPPAGYRMLKDTPVITGPKAMVRGRAIKFMGICLGSSAILFGVLFWHLAETLPAAKV